MGRHRKINFANPGSKFMGWPLWVLAFGAYGETVVAAYATGIDDALDECVDWIADHAPGLLADDEVAEEFGRILAEQVKNGANPEDEHVIEACQTEAEVDTTRAGNAGHYLNSWEWTILFEGADRDDLIDFARSRSC